MQRMDCNYDWRLVSMENGKRTPDRMMEIFERKPHKLYIIQPRTTHDTADSTGSISKPGINHKYQDASDARNV